MNVWSILAKINRLFGKGKMVEVSCEHNKIRIIIECDKEVAMKLLSDKEEYWRRFLEKH